MKRDPMTICKLTPVSMPIEYFDGILRACDKVARKHKREAVIRNHTDGSFEIIERDAVTK